MTTGRPPGGPPVAPGAPRGRPVVRSGGARGVRAGRQRRRVGDRNLPLFSGASPMFSGPFRALFLLGIVGALVGVFFGAKGALSAKHAVDSVNRKGGDG